MTERVTDVTEYIIHRVVCGPAASADMGRTNINGPTQAVTSCYTEWRGRPVSAPLDGREGTNGTVIRSVTMGDV